MGSCTAKDVCIGQGRICCWVDMSFSMGVGVGVGAVEVWWQMEEVGRGRRRARDSIFSFLCTGRMPAREHATMECAAMGKNLDGRQRRNTGLAVAGLSCPSMVSRARRCASLVLVAARLCRDRDFSFSPPTTLFSPRPATLDSFSSASRQSHPSQLFAA